MTRRDPFSSFLNYLKSHITLDTLCKHLEEVKPEQQFSIRTLGRALDRWGFTFGKGTRTQRLKEKDYVIAARQRYLRRKRSNRKGGDVIRPEVYLDESYVNKNHSNDFVWYFDDDGSWIQKPTGKGIFTTSKRQVWFSLPGSLSEKKGFSGELPGLQRKE